MEVEELDGRQRNTRWNDVTDAMNIFVCPDLQSEEDAEVGNKQRKRIRTST